jgi:nucleoside-diphosphate-sugar epimerase
LKALVTGCAGFIGSHLTERLLAEGWSVTGIDCFAPTYDTMRRRSLVASVAESGKFEFIEGNINDIDLGAHLSDVDVVFHLAARPGVRASWAEFAHASEANILATQRVLDGLVDRPQTRLVFASSSSVYGQAPTFPTPETAPLAPISPYGVTKASCEALVHAYVSQFHLTAVSLRYFTVYGPRQRSDMAFTKWIRAALSGRSLSIYGNDASAIRDFTYVSDVVDATLRAAEAPIRDGHVALNVAGGSPASLSEVLAILADETGTELSIEYTGRVGGDPHQTGGDTERIGELLGWKPEIPLRSGLARQVRWVRGDDPGDGRPY